MTVRSYRVKNNPFFTVHMDELQQAAYAICRFVKRAAWHDRLNLVEEIPDLSIFAEYLDDQTWRSFRLFEMASMKRCFCWWRDADLICLLSTLKKSSIRSNKFIGINFNVPEPIKSRIPCNLWLRFVCPHQPLHSFAYFLPAINAVPTKFEPDIQTILLLWGCLIGRLWWLWLIQTFERTLSSRLSTFSFTG